MFTFVTINAAVISKYQSTEVALWRRQVNGHECDQVVPRESPELDFNH